jgi:hypothetical protein
LLHVEPEASSSDSMKSRKRVPLAARRGTGIARWPGGSTNKENAMSLGLILLIVLVLLLVGAVPAWPHSSGWGYGPSGALGLVVLVVVVLLLMGRI